MDINMFLVDYDTFISADEEILSVAHDIDFANAIVVGYDFLFGFYEFKFATFEGFSSGFIGEGYDGGCVMDGDGREYGACVDAIEEGGVGLFEVANDIEEMIDTVFDGGEAIIEGFAELWGDFMDMLAVAFLSKVVVLYLL